MQGLIIAAGEGSRLRALGGLKPLVQLAGRPLVEHVVRACVQARLNRLIVVTGWQAELLEPVLRQIGDRCGIAVTIIRNDGWQAGNGTSVAAAAPVLDEPFVLMMADHLFDPATLGDLVKAGRKSPGADILLAIDRKLDNPLVDLEDVTRVECDGDRIVTLGKGLAIYNAYDTGLFWCTPALFGALSCLTKGGGAGSLSAGVQHVADTTSRTFGFDIESRLWIDVDDDAAWRRAEAAIAAGTLAGGRELDLVKADAANRS